MTSDQRVQFVDATLNYGKFSLEMSTEPRNIQKRFYSRKKKRHTTKAIVNKKIQGHLYR